MAFWLDFNIEYLTPQGKQKVDTILNSDHTASELAAMLDKILYIADPDVEIPDPGSLPSERRYFKVRSKLHDYEMKQLPEAVRTAMGEDTSIMRFLREVEAYLRMRAFEDSLLGNK